MVWVGSILSVIFLTLLVYVSVLIATRLNGLRTFSTMTSFDFAITIGIAGTITTVALGNAGFFQGLAALATLVVAQRVTSNLRFKPASGRVIDNDPVLLMAGRNFIHEHLQETRVTESDVRRALRSEGVLDYSQVEAVIFEPTGDISVLKKEEGLSLDPDLLRGVRGGMLQSQAGSGTVNNEEADAEQGAVLT